MVSFKRKYGFSHGGFTLLEVMVAMSIIAIALTSVFHVQFQSIVLNNHARFDVTAPLLAKSRMMQLEVSSGDDISREEKGDFGEAFPGYRWHYVITDVESDMLGDMSDRLKRIELAVTLNDGEYEYRLDTYRMTLNE